MMDLLQQFLGDRNRQQDYDDFLNRAQNNPQSISEHEAAQRYQELIQNAPPELAEEANEAVFNQLPPQLRAQMAQQFRQGHQDPSNSFQGYDYDDDDDRAADPRSLSHMARTAGTQNPDFLGQLASSPIGRAALAAGAAYLASRVLGNRGGAMGGLGGAMGGGPLGGLGGGSMGGLGGGSMGGLGGGSMGGLGGGSMGGGVIGSILGGLLGNAMGGSGGGLGGALGGNQSGRSHRRFDGTLGD